MEQFFISRKVLDAKTEALRRLQKIIPLAYTESGIDGVKELREIIDCYIQKLIEERRPIDDQFEAAGTFRTDDLLMILRSEMNILFDAFLSERGIDCGDSN